MSHSFVIGLDIGTTSVKAVAFDRAGFVISEAEAQVPLFTEKPGWAEQDPLQIEKAAILALRHVLNQHRLDPKQLLAVGVSSAMHSLICVDQSGQPLSPSLTWADTRSAPQAQRLKAMPKIDWYRQTGTPLHPMTPFCKLLWMKEQRYEPFLRASKFLSIKEFLLTRWLGSDLVDYSIAASSGMFDLHTLAWHPESLALVGITADQLGIPVPPHRTVSGLSKRIVEQTGLLPDTRFVIGSSDGHLANLGTGAIEPGEVAITIGTSGAIRQMVSAPAVDSELQTFCYPFTEQLYLIGGATNNGAITLQWLKQILATPEAIDSLVALAEKVEPGAEELLFLPYLNGERSPLWNPHARGSFFGLSIRHGREHLVRACLEGVIYNLYLIGQSLEKAAGPAQKIVASGGFSRSDLWLQIVADVFQQEVEVPVSHQSSAWGAAWLALYACGEVDALAAIKQQIPRKRIVTPQPENRSVYQARVALFQQLARQIGHHFQG
ncbi:gluconokinase [Brevibacillus fulvus]|uniref:Gluconokinase n=1 Tax=Brevibacillus fulvus TaxID=1125967 RepID=A0A938Y519_9BACL|nr:gluconokinase [Brevibacillus fulvus]MBM7591717.1 gluconokinase [Brevibacillus fulvus]